MNAKGPFGYYWEILHKESGEVINSGFSKIDRTVATKFPFPTVESEVPTSIEGFVLQNTPLYKEE